MKRPLGRSFQSVLEELAEEMQKLNDMNSKSTNVLERNTENSRNMAETEESHVC